MPFTPFHFGPGAALKAALGDRFSMIAYATAQVAMDIEPLIGMLNGAAVLHGPSHTFLGATLIGSVVWAGSAAIGRPMIRRWNDEVSHYGAVWLRQPARIEGRAAALGAFIGTFSHIALDALMHADMRPLAPLTDYVLPARVSDTTLELGCMAVGAVGVALWVFRQRAARPSATSKVDLSGSL